MTGSEAPLARWPLGYWPRHVHFFASTTSARSRASLLMLGLALHLSLGTAVVILLITGVAAAAFSSTQYALVYNIAPPDMRGRATGVLSIFIGSSMLGHWHAGLLFERLGSASGHESDGVRRLGSHVAAGGAVVAHADERWRVQSGCCPSIGTKG